jgi:hypothetical protein
MHHKASIYYSCWKTKENTRNIKLFTKEKTNATLFLVLNFVSWIF